jgi:hypothetical protein
MPPARLISANPFAGSPIRADVEMGTDASQTHRLLSPVVTFLSLRGKNSALAVGFFLELLLESSARPFAPFF